MDSFFQEKLKEWKTERLTKKYLGIYLPSAAKTQINFFFEASSVKKYVAQSNET